MVREKPIADVGAWVGHSKKSTTLDTYTHVMIGGELATARILELLGRPGDDAVMTEAAAVAVDPHG